MAKANFDFAGRVAVRLRAFGGWLAMPRQEQQAARRHGGPLRHEGAEGYQIVRFADQPGFFGQLTQGGIGWRFPLINKAFYNLPAALFDGMAMVVQQGKAPSRLPKHSNACDHVCVGMHRHKHKIAIDGGAVAPQVIGVHAPFAVCVEEAAGGADRSHGPNL